MLTVRGVSFQLTTCYITRYAALNLGQRKLFFIKIRILSLNRFHKISYPFTVVGGKLQLVFSALLG